MGITQAQWEELNKFHKKMQKMTGLKGKFASKRLLEMRPKWKRGGGGDDLALNQQIADDVVEYSEEITRTARQGNNTVTLNRQDVHVDLARVNPTLAIALFAERADDRAAAIRNILLPQTIHNYGGILVRLLLLGMDIWGTYTTWDLFNGLTNVTNSILETVSPVTPSPAPTPRNWRNGFGLLGSGPTPAPSPALPPPPEGLMMMMFNYVISGGNAVGHRARLVLAWFADYLHTTVGATQTGVTLIVFFLLTVASMLIISGYENGVRLWYGLGSIDTRPNAPVSSQQPPQHSTAALDRLRDDRGYLPPQLTGRSQRTIQNKGVRRRGKTPVSKRLAKAKEEHRIAKKRAAYGDVRRSKFSFDNYKPDKGGPGLSTGGKRRKSRKRRKRTRKRSRNLIHKLFRLAGGKRRKRKRKTKRKR
jgi:hypothetical protein